MAAVAAEALGCTAEQILVCSTGVIGRLLPMNLIEPGIRTLAPELRSDQTALELTAHAIRTTDTCIKVSTRSVTVGGREVRFTGIAKGAAMIGPNMATMLSFVLTDAPVAANDLQQLLTDAVDRSFNCISVEGHMSTNDTVLLLANGAAGGSPLQGNDLAKFAATLNEVCRDLAVAIINDAEGITHLLTIDVEGTKTDADARLVAKTIAESALVKTAIFGADPNWGRIVSAAGYAGIEFAERDLSLWVGEYHLYDCGIPRPFDAKAASAYLKNTRDIPLRVVFTLGTGRCRFWTCDLTYEYIRLNADYTT
jgi:glutamate N-acetyltransferase/amino-acid N-acetyltransferase